MSIPELGGLVASPLLGEAFGRLLVLCFEFPFVTDAASEVGQEQAISTHNPTIGQRAFLCNEGCSLGGC